MNFSDNQKIIFLFSVVILLLLAMTVLIASDNRNYENEEIPGPYYYISYAFDPYNLPEITGSSDYVFVAKVNKIDGFIPDSSGFGDSKIVYSVQVVENIKGELITGQPIHLLKSGDLSKGGKYYATISGDSLPELGRTYIFYAYAQPDGSLSTFGGNSAIPLTSLNYLEAASPSSLQNAPEFVEAVEAYQNQIVVYEVERSISIYDARNY